MNQSAWAGSRFRLSQVFETLAGCEDPESAHQLATGVLLCALESVNGLVLVER